MKIDVKDKTQFYCEARLRARRDLIYVYYMDTYINIKGYLTKLIDMLYKLGYYEDNESLFDGDKR